MLQKLTIPTLATTLCFGLIACQTTPPTTTVSTDTATLPGSGVNINPSNSDWIEEQFLTEIVNIGLEKLGYKVRDIQQADYAALHIAMANGDLTYTTGYYIPGHDDFFENAGGEKKLERIGLLVDGGGVQGIMVDKKTADQYQITNIEQLKDPKLAKLFDTDGDGKANLAGCQVGWACNNNIAHHLEVYGLKDTVEQDQGAYSALLADVLTRYKQGEPILYYAYNPHWILQILKPDEDAVWLEVPFTSLPGKLANIKEAETTVDGKNLGHTIVVQKIVANQEFVDANPVAKRWFELAKIPVADMNTESLRIIQGEDSPEDIRRHAQEWVEKNQELFDGWLEEAKNAAS